MLRYIIQRFIGMIVVMFLVVTIVFIIVRVTPGDPAAVMLGPEATEADIVQLRARLGLDQPLVVQYAYYIGQLLKGDLGQSIFLNQPVLTALGDRAEPTFSSRCFPSSSPASSRFPSAFMPLIGAAPSSIRRQPRSPCSPRAFQVSGSASS